MHQSIGRQSEWRCSARLLSVPQAQTVDAENGDPSPASPLRLFSCSSSQQLKSGAADSGIIIFQPQHAANFLGAPSHTSTTHPDAAILKLCDTFANHW